MGFKSYRKESREDYGLKGPEVTEDTALTGDQLRTGCLMRIADATEAMARNHDSIIGERDMYKRWYEEARRDVEHLQKSASALRGIITKIKSRLILKRMGRMPSKVSV